MAVYQDTTNPSAPPTPAIDRGRPQPGATSCIRPALPLSIEKAARKRQTKSVAGVTLATPADHDIVEIKGMSMAPELRDGMLVMVDRRHRTASPPGMYMVDFGAGEFAAYVESLVGQERIVRVCFADPHYGRSEMSPDELTLLGRIVCIFQPV